MRAALLALIALAWPAASLAQTFSGTYVTRNAQGGTVTLFLEQDATGKVTGTLSGNGNTFQVDGSLDGSAAVGTVRHPAAGAMLFRADLDGVSLVLVLVGVGADNEPDYSQTQEVRFNRQDATAGSGNEPGRGHGDAGDPWLGQWSDGNLTVVLQGGTGQYTGTASIQGSQFALAGGGNGARIAGTYAYNGQSFPWEAQLTGDVMTFSADGQAVQLYREGTRMDTGPVPQAAAPDVSGLSQTAREWHQWVAGKRMTQLDSYYSGAATEGGIGGGYSSRKVTDVCSDGRFFYSGSSQMGLGGDGASAYSGGNTGGAGTWRIIEQGGQVGLEFRWRDGTVSQHLLEYREEKTFVDGTRTFVTPDNQSCR